MAYFKCPRDGCRIAIFVGRPECPNCWTTGERLDTGTIDDLLSALDKRIPADQMRLAFDGPTASELRKRVVEATSDDEATRFAVTNVDEREEIK